jgi:hypothetical protein
MSEWLVWLALFELGDHIPTFWIKSKVSDRDSTALRSNFIQARESLVQAYQTIRMAVPELLDTSTTPVIISNATSTLTKHCGSLEYSSICIYSQFSRSGPLLLCLLDTGASHSRIIKAVLLKHYPQTTIYKYPRGHLVRGVGGGECWIKEYAVIDLHIPTTVNGHYILAQTTHHFDITEDNGAHPILLGQDWVETHGVIINTPMSCITILQCHGAQATLVKHKDKIPHKDL